VLALAALAALAACSSAAPSVLSSPSTSPSAAASTQSPAASVAASPTRPSPTRSSAARSAGPRPTHTAGSSGGGPLAAPPVVPGEPLSGRVIGIDPGHNGANYTDPSFLNQWIWNGRAMEHCDTTGTATNAGYSEALFTFNVSQYLRADLRSQGATVVMTRSSNSGVGPCVNTRAAIINAAHAAVAVDIHADGGPPGGRGFAILEPVADGPNDAVIGSSATFGSVLRSDFLTYTGMPVSSYDGVGGVQPRSDLAGLNLTTVPKVLIECGNMRNATDAALLTSSVFQRRAAAAIDAAIVAFIDGGR